MVVYAVHVGLNFTESGENLSRLVRLALDLGPALIAMPAPN